MMSLTSSFNDLSKCTGLDTVLVWPEVVHFAATVCVCKQDSKDFVPDLESWANWDDIQKNVIHVIIKTFRVFACCKKPIFVVFFVGNNDRLKLLL